MKVLSDEEIYKAVGFTTDQMLAYRRVEAAVLERFEIAGFEPAEPYDETRKGTPLYRLKECE